MPDGFGAGSRQKTKATTKARKRPSIGLMALEPRVMYDGAAAATAAAATKAPADGGAAALSGPPSAPPPADHPATPSAAPADSNHPNGPADSSPGGGTSAAPAETPATNIPGVGHQIVFIDGNVPDAQVLAHGVQAGIEVVILDPNSNGVQQIADYLSSHNEHDLDAIQIVSHGEEATVRLGNTILGLADISMFKDQLATIGQALKPGGDILFYGCNVGEGFAGALFEVQLSIATGGAHVAASSGLVGAAALGGSWTLDVADGVIDVGNPFTAATLADYDEVLTNQIWFSGTNSGGNNAGTQVATANVTGTNATNSNGNVVDANSYTANPQVFGSIALDAADGIYFLVNNPVSAGSGKQQILRGSISGGTPTAIYTSPDTNGPDFFGEIVYSPVTHKVYFALDDNLAPNGIAPGGGITLDTGVYSMNVDGSNVTRLVGWGGAGGAVNPHGLAIDTTNNLLFFTDFGDSQDPAGPSRDFFARVEVANLTTGAILNSTLASIDGSQAANDFYFYWGVEVDPASHTLYWTSSSPTANQGAHNEILKATYSIAATPTLGTVTHLYTGGSTSSDLPLYLTIDVANGFYYAGFGSSSVPTGTIVAGSLGSAGAPTTIYTFTTNSQPDDVLYEAAPVLSVTGSSPTAVTGGVAVDLTSSVTVTDTLQNIASATVTIGSKQTGDTLAFHGGASSWVFSDGTINRSYNSSTGVLTLSGAASAADYQQALDSVTFATTATTGTSRTFSWNLSDGHLASNTPGTSATVHLPPAISTSATATFDGGGSPVVLDATLTVSSLSVATLASASISIDSLHLLSGDTLNFTDNGVSDGNVAGSYDGSTGVLTLVSSGATATMAQWQVALRSVTYSFTSGGDPTGGGGDTTRTLTWTVNDGTLSSAADASTLNTVHTAPSLTGVSGTATYTGGGNPATLDSDVTVSVVDSSGNLASATLTIGSFQSSVDRLSVNGQSSGTIAGTNITVGFDTTTGVLTLSGSDTAAHYEAALEQVQYSVVANGDPTAGGGQTSRTISWRVNDGSTSNGLSAISTSTLDTVHTAPTIAVDGTPHYAAGGPATVLDGSITLTDPNSGGNLTGATVTISGGFLSGDTLAATTAGTSVSASYSSSTHTLTLSGTDTIAHYKTVLESVAFSSSVTDPTSGGTDTSRTIQWTVSDGSTSNGTSTTASLTLEVSAGPIIVAGDIVTFTAGGGQPILDFDLTISDPLSTTLTGATVTIGGFLAGDTITANTSGTNISAVYDASNGILTLSNSDTVATYQGVLRSIIYNSTAADPTNGGANLTRTISWQASDSIGTGLAATSTLNVRTPPVISANDTVAFTAGGPSVTADSSIGLTDVETGTIASATVSIFGGFQSGDTLHFTNGGGISGSYNSTSGLLSLTGNASLAAYDVALESITFSTSGSDITAGGTNHTRTLNWQVTDDKGAPSIASVSHVTVLDPPVVTPSGGTPTYDAGRAAVDLSGSLSVVDRQATQLTGASVAIAGNFLAGDTLAANTAGTGITALYNSVTGALALSGIDTVAHYQAVLDSVTYSSTAADPTVGGTAFTRTISWRANDSASDGGATTSTVNVRTPPTITAGDSVAFTAGGPAVAIDTSIGLTDVESGTIASATVAITGGFQSGDILNFTNGPVITGSYDATAGVLTLNGSATLANYDAALESITFSTSGSDITNGGTNHTRTLSWRVTDDRAGVSDAASSTVIVLDPPAVTPSGATPTFEAGRAAVDLSGSLSVIDREATSLTGATVKITGNFLSGDTLTANTAGTGITAFYNSSTGLLTLSNSDTLAHYQAVLDGITYSSTAADPTNGGSKFDRTITWQASDAAATGGTATSSVNVRTPPALTASDTVTFTAGALSVAGDTSIGLTDVETGTITGATVTISGGFLSGDVLHFTNQNGISGSYNSLTGALTLTGSASLAFYDAALESITFSTSGSDITNGGGDRTRTLSWQVTDDKGSASDAATSSITVNDPPVVTPSGNHSTFNAGGTAVPLDGTLTLTDREASQIASATVSITGNFLIGDTLTASTAGTAITAIYDSNTGILGLSGTDTVAHYKTVLDSITYSSNATDPTSSGSKLSRTVSVQVTDVNGPLQVSSNVANVTVDVRSPPVLTAGAAATFNVGGPAAVLDAGLTLADAQSPTITGATVSISSGLLSGDILNFTNQNGITGSYSNGVLALTGTASLANYQAALASITYSSTAADPSNGGTDPTRTISWSVNDGLSGSNTATSDLVTNGPPPSIDGVAFTGTSYVQQAAPTTLNNVLTVSDVDSATLVRATVSISAGLLAGDKLAADTTGTSISASYDSTQGILTLSGADTLANYELVLRQVTYSSSAIDPTNGGTDFTRTISWQVDDGKTANNLSAIVTSEVGTHVRPVVTAGATVSFIAGSAPILVDPGVTAVDADIHPIVSATVQITGGLLPDDVLAFNNGNPIMTFADGTRMEGTYDSSSGTLTLGVPSHSGHQPDYSPADFQEALQSVTFVNSDASPDNFGANPTRTLTWTLQTSDADSVAATSTINLEVLPAVTAGGTASYIEGGAAAMLDGGVTIVDVNSPTLSGATVSITGNFRAGDMLMVDTTGTAITAAYDAVHGVLTLAGGDTIADYQTVLRMVTYSSSAVDPTTGGTAFTRTFSWQVSDSRSVGNVSDAVTSTLDAHVRPAVTAGASVIFQAGSGPILVDATVMVADADTNPISSAQVAITAGMASGDTLAFNGGATTMSFGSGSRSIDGSYNAATGVLSLAVSSGSPTTADFQAALQSVTFANATATAGSAAAMSVRTLSWTLGTADPNQTSRAAFSMISPPPSPPNHDTGPSVGAPPVAPPPGLPPPPPPSPPGPPTGSSFSFEPPPFTNDLTPVSDTFTTGLGGVPNFFGNTELEFGITFNANGNTIVVDDAADRDIDFTAALVDGGPLPSWLRFDPKTGTFNGNPPASANGVYDIAVEIRDAQGHETPKVFHVTVGTRQAAIDFTPATVVAATERDPGLSGHSPLRLGIDSDRLGDAAPLAGAIAVAGADRPAASDAAPVGKLAFSAQLRASGRQGLLSDRQALLNSLHNGFGG